MELNRDSNKPLYRQVYEALQQRIGEGTYESGDLLPSERELGEEFGVDRITVRRSLELLVEDGLVEKRAGLGTQVKSFPNPQATETTAPTILFCLPQSPHQFDRITEPFNASLFYAIERECQFQGFDLVYRTLSDTDEFTALVNRKPYAGVFFISEIHERHLLACQRGGLPCVLVNNSVSGFTSVTTDNERGAYLATQHQIGLGHRRIAWISGIPDYYISIARANGYRKALVEAGLMGETQATAQGDWTFDGGYRGMQQILNESPEYPTGVVAANDATALGAMEALREHGLSVPEEVSIIGFDNVEQCEQVRPKLTTVAVQITVIAQVSCQQLLQSIVTKVDLGLQIIVPSQLILRDSTRPPIK